MQANSLLTVKQQRKERNRRREPRTLDRARLSLRGHTLSRNADQTRLQVNVPSIVHHPGSPQQVAGSSISFEDPSAEGSSEPFSIPQASEFQQISHTAEAVSADWVEMIVGGTFRNLPPAERAGPFHSTSRFGLLNEQNAPLNQYGLELSSQHASNTEGHGEAPVQCLFYGSPALTPGSYGQDQQQDSPMQEWESRGIPPGCFSMAEQPQFSRPRSPRESIASLHGEAGASSSSEEKKRKCEDEGLAGHDMRRRRVGQRVYGC